MILTRQMLVDWKACQEGIDYYDTLKTTDVATILDRTTQDQQWPLIEWIVPRLMTNDQRSQYASYAADIIIESSTMTPEVAKELKQRLIQEAFAGSYVTVRNVSTLDNKIKIEKFGIQILKGLV